MGNIVGQYVIIFLSYLIIGQQKAYKISQNAFFPSSSLPAVGAYTARSFHSGTSSIVVTLLLWISFAVLRYLYVCIVRIDYYFEAVVVVSCQLASDRRLSISRSQSFTWNTSNLVSYRTFSSFQHNRYMWGVFISVARRI